MEVKPTYFPSVPRMFEKIYTLATSNAPGQGAARAGGAARPEGAPAAAARRGGARPSCRQAFDQAEEALYKNVREHLRRQHPPVRDRRGADRAGDPRVLLRLRRAGDGGLRHDRDLHGRHGQHAGGLPLRLGRQAAARRRGQDRRGRRDAAARPEHLPGLLQERGGHRTRRSRTAGCTPATSARSTRTASSTSPAARRTSSSPRAARTSRRPTWRTASSRTAGSRRRWWSATAARTWSR